MKRVPDNLLEVVWRDGRVVGELLHSGPIYFRYHPDWIADGWDLSPLSLPFAPQAFNGKNLPDGLPGVISDCLPDAWGRRIAERVLGRMGAGRVTPFKLLAWVGSRGVGALSFRPAMPCGAAGHEIFAAALARQARAVVEGDVDAVIDDLGSGGSAGGAAPKALVLALPGGGLRLAPPGEPVPAGAIPSLLKLQTGREPDLAAEHGYLRMAGAAGIAVPPSRLLADTEGRRHLLIERFDLAESKRRHIHTLSGLLHAEKGGLDYADLFRVAARLGCSPDDLAGVARRMIFNVLAANHDDHGKNHSFLLDERTGRWSLSPAYDLTYSPGIERGMTIATETVPDLDTMRNLCRSAGIKPATFDGIVEDVRGAIANWTALAAEAGVPDPLAMEICKAHTATWRQIAGNG